MNGTQKELCWSCTNESVGVGLVLIRRKFDSRTRRTFSDDTDGPTTPKMCCGLITYVAMLDTPHDCAIEAMDGCTVDPLGV